MDVIKINNLSKHYGSIKAVDGLSFSVKKGEIFGFLGPNGAGKSTTIRCLMGFTSPTSGEVEVLGYDMTRDSSIAKQSIGYLSGNVRLYDRWTGWEHIRFFESVRGKSSSVDQLIARFDFNPNLRFKQLSSGNKQKLGLILALMHEPEVIIMDEPTVGLDPLLQHEIHQTLLELRQKGATVLVSSHNMPEVELLCDRVAIIKKGELGAVESIKSISQMKLSKVEVRFVKKVPLSSLRVENVQEIAEIDGGLTISVSGDINPLLAVIAKHLVRDIKINHAVLEDIFMKYYEEEVK
jgi:ABC-2 type transport system ATP-binding protein